MAYLKINNTSFQINAFKIEDDNPSNLDNEFIIKEDKITVLLSSGHSNCYSFYYYIATDINFTNIVKTISMNQYGSGSEFNGKPDSLKECDISSCIKNGETFYIIAAATVPGTPIASNIIKYKRIKQVEKPNISFSEKTDEYLIIKIDNYNKNFNYQIYCSKGNNEYTSENFNGYFLEGEWQHYYGNDNPGIKYSFYIIATDNIIKSDQSNIISSQLVKPSNVKIYLNKSGVAEKDVTLSSTFTHNADIAYYKYALSTDNKTWKEYAYSESPTVTVNLIPYRGEILYFKVKIKNIVGESEWSTVKTIKSNSLPTAPSDLICTKYPINKIDLSWTASTDIDGQDIKYNIYIVKNKDYDNILKIATTSNTTFQYDCSKDDNGTFYCFYVNAEDSFGIKSESNASCSCTKPIPPDNFTLKTESGIKEPRVDGAITIYWNKTNFHNMNGKYILRATHNKKDNDIEINKSEEYYNYDTNSINRGEYIYFKLIAINEAGQKTESNTIEIKKNQLPTTPTNILPKSQYVYNYINFSWDKCEDPDGEEIYYSLILYNSNSTNTLVTTKGTSYKYSVPDEDPAYTEYVLNVSATDSSGGESWASSEKLIKSPNPKTPDLETTTKKYYEGYIRISWEATEWKKEDGKYTIEFYVNDKIYDTVDVDGDKTYYDYNLKNITRGSRIKYRVRAENNLGQCGDWVVNRSEMYVNKIPNKSTIVVPLTNSNVYSYRPAIIIKTPESKTDDGQDTIIKVKYNGTEYDSVKNPECFSKTTNNIDNTYVIFKGKTDLKINQNTITVCTNDGLIDSETDEITLNVIKNIILVNKNDFIYSAKYNALATAIERLEKTYGITSTNSIQRTTKNNSYIKATTIGVLRDRINTVMKVINSYDTKSKFLYNVIKTVYGKNIITSDHINELINAINNI